MAVKDELGTRMKEYYEKPAQTKLTRRMPVAIRIDGKAFHTFTRGFQKPFDKVLMSSMQETMKYLCENIQGCVFGYTQSDEITLILIDYQNLNTAAWFDYEVQKICSVAASMATMAFNKAFGKNVQEIVYKTDDIEEYLDDGNGQLIPTEKHYANILSKAIEKGAMFDARCFNIPKEEVANLILWRQMDAMKNSVQMVARSKFSHNQLQGKNSAEMREMLMEMFGISWWDDFSTDCRLGSACIYTENGWQIDRDMPYIVKTDREYVNSRILYKENI